MWVLAALVALTVWLFPLDRACFSAEPFRASFASQEAPMNFNLEGKITKLEHEKFVVSTTENIIFHVRYTDKTTFQQEDGTSASAKDLRVGITVRVEGDLTESGEIVAKKIQIQHQSG